MINNLNTKSNTGISQKMINAALEYSKEGLSIFPCNKDKSPRTEHGFHVATPVPMVIHRWWKKWPDANIGLPTGRENGLIVLDVDPKNGGDEQLVPYIERIPNTLKAKTPSGFHLYFKYPKGIIVKTHRLDGKSGLDVRSDGAYVLAPPSVAVTKERPEGGRYEWLNNEKIALWPFGEHKTIDRNVPHAFGNSVLDFEEVKGAVEALDPDIGYEEWISVLMAVHSEFPGNDGLEICDVWSAGGSKYKTDEVFNKWKSFKPGGGVTINTLFKMANDTGWRHDLKSDPVIDIAEPVEVEDDFGLSWPEFPQDLLRGNGIMDDVISYTLSQSIYQQPTLSFGTALSFVSTVVGQAFCHDMQTRLNTFILGVGGTGTGKEAPRKAVTDLLEFVGLGDRRAGDDIASGTALMKRMSREPTSVFLIDEFSHFLGSIKDGRISYKADLLPKLMSVFTSSGSVIKATEYATKENKFDDIAYPYMNVFAMTTPEHFFDIVGDEDASSGFLNRLLIIKGIDRPKFNEIGYGSPPESIKEWMQCIAEFPMKFGCELEGITSARPLPFSFSHESKRMFTEFRHEIENVIFSNETSPSVKNIWNRSIEKVIKISMLFAVAEVGSSVFERIIEDRHLEKAIRLVRYSVETCLYGINHIRLGSRFDKDCEIVLNAIKKFGGKWVSRKDLYNHTRKVDTRERVKVVAHLVEDGDIEEKIVQTKTKPIKCYRTI